MNEPTSIDIFCAVVDNFGDIGVCWRLARQMAVERGLKTRLFVDDMASFHAIVPEPDTEVTVSGWTVPAAYQAADIVIEAFACTLPEHVIAAMVVRRSVWIDLEYLSAEDWVAGCHAIPSVHPSTGLTKTLFFPGFDTRTGGLIRENDLISRKNAFLSDKNAQNIWRKARFLPVIAENTIDISFFCYKTAPVDGFFRSLGRLGKKVRVFWPRRDVPLTSPSPREGAGPDNVEIWEIPFLSQYDYDSLLWTSDFNCVRGEDSFVRAQWAGKPFLWNIYVQEENAHLVKLRAFLDKIKPFYDVDSFERLANLHDLWNEGGQIQNRCEGNVWREAMQSLAGLRSGAQNWTDNLVNQTDLATQLLTFATQHITENKG